MLLKILFYLFSMILIYSGLRVVTARNPVTAALHLILAFATVGALWMIIQAEFLALSLVVIYVGAVMVLFLFVVMMLDLPHDIVHQGFTRYLPLGVLVALVMIVEMGLVLANKSGLFVTNYPHAAMVRTLGEGETYSNTAELGMVLYTNYLYAFEIAAFILLVAMIAAISLTHRPRRATNKSTMAPSEQYKSTPEKGMRLVKMPFSKWEETETKTEEEEAN